MLAQQLPGRGLHGLAVELVEHPAHTAGFDAGAHRGLQQHIGIAARRGAKARMEVIAHGQGPLHGDVGRQEGVGAADPGIGRAFQIRVEMHHLHDAVHAGVGAAGAYGGHGLRGKAAQGRFEMVLHRAAGRLALPAVVVLAVVTHTQSYAHGSSWPDALGAGLVVKKNINLFLRAGAGRVP
ncbi:hypothetical protein D3C78_1303530 [compost metagenome]